MRSIFLGDGFQIGRVYHRNVAALLKEEAGLASDTVFSSADLGVKDFSGVEYVFSTWGMPVIAEEDVRKFFPNLKAVFYAAGSVKHFAPAFLKAGVRVFSAWKANAVPVIEYACSQILLANKGFFHSSLLASGGDYRGGASVFGRFPGNYGCPVGIIGAGAIGSGLIRKLKEHRLDVYVYDPFITAEKAAELGAVKVDTLEVLFSTCRTVSNHSANIESTKGMLTGSLFAMLPEYSTFINTGRGAQVDEKGLVKVLEARKDIFAILDVTWPEPPEKGHLFYSLPNVILTPHIAGSSGSEVRRMAEYMAEEFIALKNGAAPRYEVTGDMLASMA
jgi:phosphoglycerate dehydrogenase-like enzyme